METLNPKPFTRFSPIPLIAYHGHGEKNEICEYLDALLVQEGDDDGNEGFIVEIWLNEGKRTARKYEPDCDEN